MAGSPSHLAALVEAQVARTPRATAVAAGPHVLTYQRLNDRANRLAHHLIAAGLGPDRLVAVAVPHSVELVVALLGVVKAGAAYLPLDPDHPADRIAWTLRDAAPGALVRTRRTPCPPGVVPIEVVLDDPATAAALERYPGSDPTDAERTRPLSARDAVYVIYTSGSTGQPKGVVVEHRALVDYLRWTSRAYPGARGVSVVPTSVAFDLTVTGLYTPLVSGGCAQLARLPGYRAEDLDRLRRVPCTFLKVTPSHLDLLAALPAEFAPRGELLLGGEALLGGGTLERWRREHPDTVVLNVYGPTEATVNCAEYRIEPGDPVDAGPVPIGRAQPGARLYVLDPGLTPVPPGVVGELFIAGTGLARGYLGRPAATAERFRPDPLGPPGERMYRTGDLVRRLDDGRLVFAGRVDDQVKIRGFRVEPGEVESVLAGHPAVGRAACVVRGGAAERRLVAYVVARPGRAVDEYELRRYAGRRLPAHQVPAEVVVLDQLPLTPNRKVDRAALADRVDAPAQRPGQRWLAEVLALRPAGDQPPLFCLPPETGLTWGYRALLGHLPADRPLYGLQPWWLADGERCPATVDELADGYLRRLRTVQHEGPYHLLGVGFGGSVAYAMAARLRAEPGRVAFLCLVQSQVQPTAVAAGGDELTALLRSLRADPTGPRLSRLDDIVAVKRVWQDCRRLAGTSPAPTRHGDLLVVRVRTNPPDPLAREALDRAGPRIAAALGPAAVT